MEARGQCLFAASWGWWFIPLLVLLFLIAWLERVRGRLGGWIGGS
jgi:apolipoprotein N-acyltransferase